MIQNSSVDVPLGKATIRAIDHAFTNENGSAKPQNAGSDGMTGDEKTAVSGILARDEKKGAAVHVGHAETICIC